jgi:small-conductance mechanosensitive channel
MPEDIVPEELHRLDAIELVRLGKSSVTVGGLLTAVVIVIAAILVARLIGGVLRRLRSRSGEAAPQVYIVEKLASYGVVFFGLIAAFSTLGLDLTSLTFFAGALGVGLGFGLQGVFREFISGLVLIFDRLVRIGDYIQLQTSERGVVEEIGPRATRIRNNDDVNIMIPNSRLIEGTVINWTHNNGVRRFHVPFIVAYGSDKEKVREAVLKAARDVPFTLPDTERRKTQVWLVGFGENGLKFELVVWPALEAVKRPNTSHAAYTWAIEDALTSGGFEIPLPQRDLRVRSLFNEEGEEAKAALRLKPVKRASTTEPAHTTVNDAAEDVVRSAVEDAIHPVTPKRPETP